MARVERDRRHHVARALWLAGTAVLGLGVSAVAHELCRDPNFHHAAGALSFCGAYANRPSCCDASLDAAVQAQFLTVTAQTSNQGCSDMLKTVMCTRCDAWEDHLYERSSQTGSAPTLCPDFCRSVYDACAGSVLIGSLFAPSNTSPTVLRDIFPTQESFCSKFAPSDASYCFNGEPYEPPELQQLPSDKYEVCVEHLSDYDDDMIGIVPLPNRFDVLVSYTRGGLMRVLSASTGRINTGLGNNGVLGTVTLFCPTPSGGSEQGLLSVVFRPDFATSGYFYIYGNVASSANNGVDTAIREWHCSDPAQLKGCVSGSLVMHVYQPFGNHNGAHMQFMPNNPRLLIISLGDGGSSCDPSNFATNNNQLLGKVLRIVLPASGSAGDFAYEVPSDNPFGTSGSDREMCGKNPSGQRAGTTKVCQEIWALGLRNPFRCSIDRFDPTQTYNMYCGDVGQAFAEEVDIIPTQIGGNPSLADRLPLHYGWDIFEGDRSARVSGGNCGSTTSTCPAGVDSRVTEATTSRIMECPLRVEFHSQGWRSLIGGYVCRRCNEAALQNRYIYADYVMKGLVVIDPANPATSTRLQTQLCTTPSCGSPDAGGRKSLQQSSAFVWSFGEDNHGNLYLINPENGLYRILPQSACTGGSADPEPSGAFFRNDRLSMTFQLLSLLSIAVLIAGL